LFKLFQARQLIEIREAEAHQEILGRAIHDRASQDGLAPGGHDESLLEKCFDDARHVDAANLLNLRPGSRLAVRDHCERFERGHRQAQRRAQALDEAANHFMMLRLGVKPVAPRDRADLDAAIIRRVRRDHFVQRRAHDHFFLANRSRDLLERSWLVRGVDDGLEGAFHFRWSHGRLFILIFNSTERLGQRLSDGFAAGKDHVEHFMLSQPDS